MSAHLQERSASIYSRPTFCDLSASRVRARIHERFSTRALLCVTSQPPTASVPTTCREQDDIVPSAYMRHTLANSSEGNFLHRESAKPVPGRTAPGVERST